MRTPQLMGTIMLCHGFVFSFFFFLKVVSYFRKKRKRRNNVSRLKLDIELQRRDLVWKPLCVCKNCYVTLNPQMLKTRDREHVILVEPPRLVYRHTKDSLLIIKDNKTTNSYYASLYRERNAFWMTLILWLPNRISLGEENEVTLKNILRFSK